MVVNGLRRPMRKNNSRVFDGCPTTFEGFVMFDVARCMNTSKCFMDAKQNTVVYGLRRPKVLG